MIDPTDDTYAEREFKDGADFLGSDDASLEMGVCAVAAWIVAWLFFKAFFWPVVLLSLAILAWRVFRGQTTPQALWARITALPGQLDRFRQRLHVKVVVKMLPEDVTDAEDLKGRLFHSPPQNLDHQHYRDTFAVLALVDRTPEQDLQLAQYLRGLKAYGEDPIRMMASQLRRKIAPSTKPAASMPQGFAALPIPGLNWLTQALAVALVLVGLWGVWGWKSSDHNDKRADRAEENAAAWEQSAIQNASRAQQADAMRAQETATARAELEKSRTLATTTQGRLRSLAAREKKRNEEALSGAPVDPGERLRDLADPAAAGAAAPAAADSERSPG